MARAQSSGASSATRPTMPHMAWALFIPRSARLSGMRQQRGWACVGRTEDLAREGAWLRVPLTPAGLVVTRGTDELHGFHAVCTHRGSTLLDAGEGCAESFTCPYHGARFDLAGRP